MLVMAATLGSFIWRANYLRHHPVGQQPSWVRWGMAGLVLVVCATEFSIVLATDHRPITAGRVITMIIITAAVVGYVLWRFSAPRGSSTDGK
jgi:hypothetical protein